MTKFAARPDGFSRIVLALACLLWPGLALAHVGQGDISGGFLAGVAHPVLGPDHVVAMVAVGIWGAQLGAPAIWVLPVTFPIVMAFGGVLGGLGVPIPGIETGIALSAIVLGGMIAIARRPPLWVAAFVVGVFAIFHGHAHGAELPESANAISYSVGFVAATGSLHALGILIGLANRWSAGAKVLRAGGGVIAACGFYFLTGHLIAGQCPVPLIRGTTCKPLKADLISNLTTIHHQSENPRNRRQARRESSTVAGAGEKWSRDRRREEEGPRTFSVRGSDLGGDRGRRAIPLRLISGRIPNLKMGPLLRLNSRPACGDAIVEPANARSSPARARLWGHIPEGTLFRPPTRTARTRNTAWRRFSSVFSRESAEQDTEPIMPARLSMPAARAGVAVCLLFAAGSAYAHSAAHGAGDFYAGALHALTALEHVLPFLALGVLAGQQGRKAEPVLLVFCLALAAGATVALWTPPLPYVGLLNIFSAILFGGLAAAAWSLPMAFCYGIAAVFGLSHGFANGAGMIEQTKPYLYIPGVALAGLAVTAYGLIVTDYLLRRKADWIHIAVRVAGSWIAAIGILVLATSGAAILKA